MAEVRDTKRYYYASRSRYMREIKQIERKLSLAVTEEEYMKLLDGYRKVEKRLAALKVPEGVKSGEVQKRVRVMKPEFDEAYVELTLRIRELYSRKSKAKTRSEQDAFDKLIEETGKKRGLIAKYTEI